MRKVFLILSIFFALLTIAGCVFVILSHGKHSAGYAVVPMVFSIIFTLSRKKNK